MHIQETLLSMQDTDFRDFQKRLIPDATGECIGIRTPALRSYARELLGTDAAAEFMQTLPHRYFDENQLHAFLLSEMRDPDALMQQLEHFLPYVDNWATCDQLRPKVFRKHPERLPDAIRRWIRSEHPYTVRFGIGMLMVHFLDARFSPDMPGWVAAIRREEYYVNMMRAWYFATALAKQYETALCFLEENRLDVWTHNMTIRKARESCRIPAERKAYLHTLKRANG